MVDELPSHITNGRGAISKPVGRFERYSTAAVDDGWRHDVELNVPPPSRGRLGGGAIRNPNDSFCGGPPPLTPAGGGEQVVSVIDFDPEEFDAPKLRTNLHVDTSKSVINYVKSPDLYGMRTINPYRGCEHGCIYCFARPTHSYLGFSPGLDFETEIFYKPDAPDILRRELAAKKYDCAPITLGSNTDCYQPVERGLKLTRRIIEVLSEHNHPLVIITKSALVARDIDLLAPMAEKKLVRVLVSVTTLDTTLARAMEPRAATPPRRLATIKALADAGIPVTVMVAPLISALNDMEMEKIMQAAWDAGARNAHYTVVRLPYELKDLFTEWLKAHRPGRAEHVLSLIRQMRGGKLYDATYGERRVGTGTYADLIATRFRLACNRISFNERFNDSNDEYLRTDLFTPPNLNGQLGFEFG